MFKGSYVALITPMDDMGNVDYSSLQNLVNFHISNGTHGLVSVGTTGESATLPFDEHIEVVKKTVEFANGQIPVVAGSGANSTDEAMYLGDKLEDTGVAGLLSVVPYYNKPQQRGITAHFEAIADATSLPVLLYNVPGRTVADMLPETVAELAQHTRIVGLKDATGDLQRYQQTKALVPDDFVLLSGDDPSSCEFLNAGGDGVISVTANIAPAEMALLCDAALGGDADRARIIDGELTELHRALFIEPNPVMPKWALAKMGLISTPNLRLPLVLPELESKKIIEDVMRRFGVLS